MKDLLAELNEPQREAVRSTEGPLLILAGAGSGKTRVITYRVAYLIGEGVANPREIVAVTFTNKAAGEMKDRVARLLGGAEAGAWVGTFHALCLRILRREGALLGYSPGFVVYDTADQLGLLRGCIKEQGLDEAAETARAMLHRISSAKNRLQTVEDVEQDAAGPGGEVLARLYRAYQEGLKKNNAVDFDDLLLQTILLFERFSGIAERYASSTRFLLVDEYQDTNHAQYRLIRALAARHRNVCCVGDEDQCLVRGTLVTMADGTTKPIERIRVGDLVRSCYGSGDFRSAPVTGVFRRKRSGQGVAITTEKGRCLVSTPEHTHFAGYRRGIVPQTHFTYMMSRKGMGFRLGTSQVYTSGVVKPVVGYLQETILVPQPRDSSRRNVVVTLCGDRRGPTPMHGISMVGNDEEGRRILESLGLSVRPAKKGSSSWRFETASKDFRALMRTVERLRSAFDINLIMNARLGRNGREVTESNSLPFVPACNLRPGVAMFDSEGGYDVVKSVEWVELGEEVFDLNVEATYNFIANGLVTHNSIFSWRGADIGNILDFKKDYPDARIVKLEQNYRSTRTILAAADSVISHNTRRIGKTLWTENSVGEELELTIAPDDREEAEQVLRIVRSMTRQGRQLDDIAVLYRTNNQSRLFEEVFLRERLPHRVVGSLRFYERKEIKDLVAYLRVLINPDDDLSLTRVFNVPPRGIGQGTLDALVEIARTEGLSLWRAMALGLERGALPARAEKALREFLAVIEEIREVAVASGLVPPPPGNPNRDGEAGEGEAASERSGEPRIGVTDLLGTITGRIRYAAHLEKSNPGDFESRLLNLDALISAAAEYDEQGAPEGLQGFVDRSSLRSDTDDIQGKNGVTLMTVHSAKGLEFPVVIVTGLEENIFPHIRSSESQAELEEERRLFYVAMTRARDRLLLTAAATRRSFGDFVENPPSRFLEEIPQQVLRERHVASSTRSLAAAGYNPWRAPRREAPASPAPAETPRRHGQAVRHTESVHYNPGGDEDGYAVGMKVIHPMFGKGTISAVEGSGPSVKLTIKFREAGIRKILPRHTTLTVGR